MKNQPGILLRSLLKIFHPHLLLKTVRNFREHRIQILVIQRLGFTIGTSDNSVTEDELMQMERYNSVYAPAFRMIMWETGLVTLVITDPERLANKIVNRLRN